MGTGIPNGHWALPGSKHPYQAIGSTGFTTDLVGSSITGNKNKAELQWEVHLKRIENPDLEACGGEKNTRTEWFKTQHKLNLRTLLSDYFIGVKVNKHGRICEGMCIT